MLLIKDAVNSFVWAWQAEKLLAKNTVDAYLKDLTIFADFLNKEFSITCFEKSTSINFNEILQKFYLFLKNNYANATLARRISTAFQFVTFVNNEFFQKDQKIDKPKVKLNNVFTPFLSNEDLDKIRNVLQKDSKSNVRLSAMIEILYSTGMRTSELLRIKIQDIENIIQKKYLLIKGKGENERFVFFNDLSINALTKYINSPFFINLLINQKFLFGSKAKALSRQRLFQLLKKIALEADVDPEIIFAHGFRHRMLTNLVIGGADLISVQKIAGHKQINTTARYTHIEDYLYDDILKNHPIKDLL